MTHEPSLRERDAAAIWHPATHFADLERVPPLPIVAAQGVWLRDASGREILDGIGSWWTSVHGHCHPHIAAAIARQAATLDHVMFAGFTHEPAVALAERLLALAPREPGQPGASAYGKVFFSDCGSASIEVALKLAFQSRLQRGQPHKRRFATLANSYHGETLGALAVCGSATWREPFGPLLRESIVLPCPALPEHRHAWLDDPDAGAAAPETAQAIALLEAHADELAALIVEPIIQCAGKMRMPGVGYLRSIAQACRRLDIQLIADEIAVAFGRTGRMFACEWAELAPELVCLSKGLSGGTLPLAATLIRRGFEHDFAGEPSRSFMHSHSFTANPIACAAGLASLELFEQEAVLARTSSTIARLGTLAAALAADSDAVLAHRQAGMVVAFDLDARRGPSDGRLSLALRSAALERGVLVRPLHDTLYWMPALSITAHELEHLAEVSAAVVHEVLG